MGCFQNVEPQTGKLQLAFGAHAKLNLTYEEEFGHADVFPEGASVEVHSLASLDEARGKVLRAEGNYVRVELSVGETLPDLSILFL